MIYNGIQHLAFCHAAGLVEIGNDCYFPEVVFNSKFLKGFNVYFEKRLQTTAFHSFEIAPVGIVRFNVEINYKQLNYFLRQLELGLFLLHYFVPA